MESQFALRLGRSLSVDMKINDTIAFGAPPTLQMSEKVRAGAGWSLASLVGRQLISLGATAVLARVLSATDYGLFGMVVAIIALIQAFADLGLSSATVQCNEISKAQIDSLFFINAAFGLLLWALSAFCGKFLVSFYHRPQLAGVTALLGASFFFAGCAAQPLALLRRKMRFKQITLCDQWSTLCAAVVGIGAALMGFGYWALVIQVVAQQFSLVLLLLLLGEYKPSFPRTVHGLSNLLKVGGYMAGYSAINYFSRNLDNVLVGRVCGAEQLGYYSRAYFLMTLPTLLATGMLSGVMIPALSALQGDRERMAAAFLRSIRWITLLGCPLALGLAACAPEFVRFVYGPRWTQVVPLLLWLCLAGAIQPVQAAMGWLYVVVGRTRTMFFVGLATSAVMVGAFSIGICFGAVGVARAYAAANTCLAVPVMLIGHRIAGLELRRTLAVVGPLFIASIVMASCVMFVGVLCKGTDYRLRLVSEIAVGVGVYMLCVRISAPDLWREAKSYLFLGSTFDARAVAIGRELA
jgi:O-antigen/teichoic acid export membrane protein